MEQEHDILGDILDVATHIEDFRQETIILVLQAAVAEIMDLRIALAVAHAAQEEAAGIDDE